MNRITLAVLLFALLLLAVSIGSCAINIRAMTNLAAEVVAPPPSATDIVMQSRQTPPADNHRANAVLWFAVLLLGCLAIGAFWLARLYLGARYAREMRLARKRPSARRAAPPTISPPIINVPQVPPVRRVPPNLRLEDGE